MNINFYATKSEYNRLTKVLSDPVASNGVLFENTDIYHIKVRVKYSRSLLTKNYAYIPIFGLYYWVTPQIDGETIIFTLTYDKFMSFKNDILNSTGNITRSGNLGDPYMVDSMVTTNANFTIQARKLGNGFTKKENYIMTIGGSN